MVREDVELQILEHLRALRQELSSLHAKVDALAENRTDRVEAPDDEQD